MDAPERRSITLLPAAASVAGILLAVIPFYASVVPPMTDVSQHILVSRIVRGIHDPGLRFADYFTVSWQGAPTDLFYWCFGQLQALVGPFGGARLYLTLWVGLLWASVWFLARAFSRTDAWLAALLALPLAFSWYVYMGFLPFLMALPLFAFTMGVWFREFPWRWKLPLLWVLLVALFGFHVVGAAAAGAAICLSAAIGAIHDAGARRRRLGLAIAAVIPLPLLLVQYLTGANAPSVRVAPFDLVRNVLGVLKYTCSSLARPGLYVMLFWVAVLAALAFQRWRRQRDSTHLIAGAVLFSLLAAAMPGSLGALWPAGPRLFPFALILLASGIACPVRWRSATAGGALSLLVVMSWLTTQRTRELDVPFRVFLSGTQFVAAGARLLPVLVDPFEGSRDVSPFWSLASSYTILRGGANPYVFARPYIRTGASPVQYLHRELFPFAFLLDSGRVAGDYRGVSCCYDDVLLWGSSPAIDSVLRSELRLVHQQGKLSIYHNDAGAPRP